MAERPDYATTIRAHHANAEAWVVAAREPCVAIQREEVRHIHRVIVPVAPENLPDAGRLPASWLLAVLLCPGDDTADVAGWTARLSGGCRDRVRFYHHPAVDLVEALEPWYGAGLDDPLTFEVHDFKTFHKQFGRHFNDQIYRDATGWAPPP